MWYKGLVFQVFNSLFFVLCSYIVHYFLGQNMTPAEYGTWGIILVILDFEYLFVNNGVRQAVAREVAYKRFDTMDIIKKSVILQMILVGALSMLTVFSAKYLSAAFHDASLEKYIQFVSVILPFTGIYVITQGGHNGLFLLVRESMIGILYSILKLSIIPLCLYTGLPVVMSAELGYVIAAVGGLITGTLSLYQKRGEMTKNVGKLRFKKFMKDAFNYSLFFIIVSVALSIDTLILRIFTIESETIGFYTGAVNFGKISYYVLTAFFLVILPVIADLYEKNDFRKLRETVYTVMILINVFVLPIPVFLMASGKQFLLLFYGADYASASSALFFLSLSDFLMGLIVVFHMIAEVMERKKFSAVFSVCMICADVSLVSLLTKRMGMAGTAMGSCLCTAVFCIVSFLYVSKLTGMIIDRRIVSSVGIAGLYGLVVWQFFQWKNAHNIFAMAGLYIVLYIVYVLLMVLFRVISLSAVLQMIKTYKGK